MITILDILQEHFHSIRPGLGPQWPEFSRRVDKLTGRFQAIAAEEQPAPGAVQAAVNDLLEICRDYPYLAGLLGLGSKRPPAPAKTREVSFANEAVVTSDLYIGEMALSRLIQVG